ncbi:MAG TPA: hypothetical protein VLF41_03400, partial [Candidatus Nanoarchaeia archaeon]|nr:hypothetical protein [Candidatus Nanoarchaeia archaeon]
MEEEPTQVYGLDDQPTGVMDTGVMDPGDPNPTPNMTPTDVYEAVDLPTEARDFPDLEDADLVTTATQPLRPTGSRTSADGYRLIIGALKRVRLEERLAYLLAPILDAFYVNGRPVLVEPDALNLISDDVLDNLMGQPKAAIVGELQQLVNHLPL